MPTAWSYATDQAVDAAPARLRSAGGDTEEMSFGSGEDGPLAIAGLEFGLGAAEREA